MATFEYNDEIQQWEVQIGTYDAPEDEPPSYGPVETYPQHVMTNSENLMTLERTLRAAEADRHLSGQRSYDRPFHIATPSYAGTFSDPEVGYSTHKHHGNIVRGELSYLGRPEHIRVSGVTILNPALLDSVPSTAVTPIPVLLFNLPTRRARRHRAINDLVESVASRFRP